MPRQYTGIAEASGEIIDDEIKDTVVKGSMAVGGAFGGLGGIVLAEKIYKAHEDSHPKH